MKTAATEIFEKVKKQLIVKSYKYSQIDNKPCVDFSYYDSIKSWSHNVSLAYDDKKIYLYSARMIKNNDLKNNLFREYNEREAMYKIEVSNATEVIDFLRKYDRFQYQF